VAAVVVVVTVLLQFPFFMLGTQYMIFNCFWNVIFYKVHKYCSAMHVIVKNYTVGHRNWNSLN
jgi:hypothetical protein